MDPGRHFSIRVSGLGRARQVATTGETAHLTMYQDRLSPDGVALTTPDRMVSLESMRK